MMKRHSLKFLCLAFIGSFMLGTLVGCNNTNNDSSESSGKKKITVGFSMATLKEDRWLRDRDIFSAKANEENIDVIVMNANNDTQEQYRQVKGMIEKGIDVLVIVPQDCEDSAPSVELAKKAGIPVISYDRLVSNSDVNAYVSFDNVKVGQLQAHALLNKVPQGGYLILNGAQSDYNSSMFHQGYMNQLQSATNRGQVKILAQTWVKDWRRESAYSFVSEQLTKNADQIQAILAANDSLAWGAIDALSEAKLTKKVVVVGHDADLAACQRIVDGTQYLTIYKPIDKLVDKAVELCKTLAQKQKIDYEKTINNGQFNVPYLMIDVIPVTKENMDDTVIKDGFQIKEEVYRTTK